ncbi:MAG: preprotein translocase subunit SecE [Bacteroidetes bacterium]|nr:preprotein translocase subunit SecE [Bacteroidota bacterium]
MPNLKLFILGSLKELKEKVTWPSYKTLQSSTILVIVSAIIFSIFLGFLDGFFKKVISYIYGSF